jgi:hypothetical protein
LFCSTSPSPAASRMVFGFNNSVWRKTVDPCDYTTVYRSQCPSRFNLKPRLSIGLIQLAAILYNNPIILLICSRIVDIPLGSGFIIIPNADLSALASRLPPGPIGQGASCEQ